MGKIKLTIGIGAATVALGAAYNKVKQPLQPGAFRTFYRYTRPLWFTLFDAENAHKSSIALGKMLQVFPWGMSTPRPMLSQTVEGLQFINPVGIAPGFDKNAELMPLMDSVLMDVGFHEVGSVSANPCEGNPKPRCFRLPLDRAVVNRMGLNNDGSEKISSRLIHNLRRRNLILGVNLAKTHDPTIMGDAALADFELSFSRTAPFADYVTINVSCPNTAEGKTFEDPVAFTELIDKLMQLRKRILGNRPPVFVKFSPPLPVDHPDHLESMKRTGELVQIALDRGVNGFVVSNTAADRSNIVTDSESLKLMGSGGLSGDPVAERSDALVRYLFKLTNGSVPIIGVGGISSPEAAYRKIRNGATLIQVYTGLVYEGPSLVNDINNGLEELLRRDGFEHISQAIGIDAK